MDGREPRRRQRVGPRKPELPSLQLAVTFRPAELITIPGGTVRDAKPSSPTRVPTGLRSNSAARPRGSALGDGDRASTRIAD